MVCLLVCLTADLPLEKENCSRLDSCSAETAWECVKHEIFIIECWSTFVWLPKNVAALARPDCFLEVCKYINWLGYGMRCKLLYCKIDLFHLELAFKHKFFNMSYQLVHPFWFVCLVPCYQITWNCYGEAWPITVSSLQYLFMWIWFLVAVFSNFWTSDAN